MASTSQVSVAIGVIRQDASILVTRRLPSVDCPNLWEFPGGKMQQHETVEAGLARELYEEINIQVVSCRPVVQFRHVYSHAIVTAYVYLIQHYLGEPKSIEGQQMQWVTLEEILDLNMLDANKVIISQL
ncbi:MAG: 8-oxo-dGTP diphosphatase MutT [Coxiellaceae bacterium]|nr:8-oxo-dGTP diphosphatase MutT [Coxiellaceae bacterium]|tara:strand:+ start:89 stop:475 length:387 start_codon:yes stop_codon:yes gene_type:complete